MINIFKEKSLENKLLKKYGKARILNKSITLLVIADTHGDLYLNKNLRKKQMKYILMVKYMMRIPKYKKYSKIQKKS